MRKHYLSSNKDLEKVKKEYAENMEWLESIDEVVKGFPCVLLASYADDIEFGDYYQFEVVTIEDFQYSVKPALHFSLN